MKYILKQPYSSPVKRISGYIESRSYVQLFHRDSECIIHYLIDHRVTEKGKNKTATNPLEITIPVIILHSDH